MLKEKTKYCIDVGNTQVKVACFEGDTLKSVKKWQLEELSFNQKIINKINDSDAIILSSVLEKGATNRLLNLFPTALLLNNSKKLPFINKYKTPNSLGTDRICNAAFAHVNNKFGGVLIVDVGTCVKFDFVNTKGEYVGGSISPGLHLRYKAMNDYTALLPLLSSKQNSVLEGATTEECMHSGVVNGLKTEILGMIAQYQTKNKGLTTFMTGGDADLFDKPLKNSIFVDENLTLKGLNIILEHNAH